MTGHEFVKLVRTQVLDRNLSSYEDLLAKESQNSVTDPDWQRAVEAYRSMNAEQQSAVLLFGKQVMVDTISNLFGILDGSTLLDDHRDDFLLTYGTNGKRLNGELQDAFLSSDEPL